MVKSNKFLSACCDNKVKEVRRMMSEGVNINEEDSRGVTGLILAMSNGNTEVSVKN